MDRRTLGPPRPEHQPPQTARRPGKEAQLGVGQGTGTGVGSCYNPLTSDIPTNPCHPERSEGSRSSRSLLTLAPVRVCAIPPLAHPTNPCHSEPQAKNHPPAC